MKKPVKPQSNNPLRDRALRLLARREYAREELKFKLDPQEEHPTEVEQLLDDLCRRGWLSDERFAEEWVTQRSRRYGRQRLEYELKQKGVASDLIEQALTQHLNDEFSQAHQVWLKKFGQLPQDDKEKAKQIRFLQYRGFGWEIIQQIFRQE